MIIKRYLGLILAFWLLVSISCSQSQENQSIEIKSENIDQKHAAETPYAILADDQETIEFYVTYYAITYPSGTISQNNGIEIVTLFGPDEGGMAQYREVGYLIFVRDDSALPPAEYDAINKRIILCYPISKLDSILSMFVDKASVKITYKMGPSGVPFGGITGRY
ncbi:Uncharacterised protein [uncultured archaeon]|nr:Uncharacterised protein [uncultured archaeon]